MHVLASTVSVFLAVATRFCNTCEGMPPRLHLPKMCNFQGREFPFGTSITLNGTCERITCYGRTMKIQGCPRQQIVHHFCWYVKSTGIDYPACCPIYYCSTYRSPVKKA